MPRKRQTRLALTPLPSSSPAASTHPDGISDRVATIRYDDGSSPLKKQRLATHLNNEIMASPSKPENVKTPLRQSNIAVVIQSPSKNLQRKILAPHHETALLTPLASSQTGSRDTPQDLEVVLSSSDSSISTESESRTASNIFSNRERVVTKGNRALTTPTSNRSFPPKLILSREGRPLHHKKRSKPAEMDLSWVPVGGDFPSTPKRKASKVVASKHAERSDGTLDVRSEDDAIPTTLTRRRKSYTATVVLDSDESSVDALPKHRSPRRTTRNPELGNGSSDTPRHSRPTSFPRVNARLFLLGGSSGYAPVPSLRKLKTVTPTEKGSSRAIRRQTRSFVPIVSDTLSHIRSTRSTTRANGHQKPVEGVNEDEDDSSATETEESLTKPLPIVPVSNDTSSTPIEEANDEVSQQSETSKPADISMALPIMTSTESDDSEDVVVSPVRRKRIVRKVEHLPSASPKESQVQAIEDIQEDLDDLEATEVRKTRTRARIVSSKKSARQKQLDLLKRRRAGDNTIELSSNTETDTPAINDNDSESEDCLDVKDDVSEATEDSGTEAVRQSLRGNFDEYDEDFVDDDDDTLGAPHGLEEIPLEFTRHAHRKPIVYFKDAVEWMTHNKLNPAFARDDPVYRMAFHKLDDEVHGYSVSKFLSAAWNARFLKALKARPEFQYEAVPTMFDHKCDACNRSGHPAKFRIILQGKAYHRESLEIVSDDEEDEEDEDEDDDANSHDSQGNSLPSTEVQYFVGRFCQSNAEKAHALLHWRYHLNQWILDWLKEEGHITAEKIVEREKWSVKKRGEYADRVVDSMEEMGEIKALHRDFKNLLATARDGKVSRE